MQGANITTLFGVGGSVNYAAAISAYVDPAGSGAGQGITFLPQIAGLPRRLRQRRLVGVPGLTGR